MSFGTGRSYRVLAILMLLAAAPGRARSTEFRCDLPTANPWLTSAPEGFRDRPPIDSSRIQPVSVREPMAEAVARLADRSVSPLTRAQAARLTRAPAPVGASAPRPSQVRAVYPGPNPRVVAIWIGRPRLVLSADGMGCARFVKHPLVLWLDRGPARLFVVAGATL
jgi:hypothetical protein